MVRLLVNNQIDKSLQLFAQLFKVQTCYYRPHNITICIAYFKSRKRGKRLWPWREGTEKLMRWRALTISLSNGIWTVCAQWQFPHPIPESSWSTLKSQSIPSPPECFTNKRVSTMNGRMLAGRGQDVKGLKLWTSVDTHVGMTKFSVTDQSSEQVGCRTGQGWPLLLDFQY